MEYVVGIDIGGTCTDCVVVDERGQVRLGKAFSTPPDFSGGILDALGVAARELRLGLAELLRSTRLFLHSTTVAENAVVDGTLSRAGLIVNEGFEDTLFATRGGYGRWSGLTEEEKRNPIETDKLPPIVPGGLIRGLKQRTDVAGRVVIPADEAAVEVAVRGLLDQGVEALGVSLLWSFLEPRAEQMVREVARRLRPGLPITLSHEIAPIVGEYERTSTVALNARLEPVVARYMDRLRTELRRLGFQGTLLVMQAYGGLLPADQAASRPVGMIESGPVSGLVGSKQLGEALGFRDIIAADMGGTTFKVGVVREGLIEYQRESMVVRYHYALPKMDVVSLGLAGGSVISVAPETGVPQIGPQSAGSYPGPICYGHGGREPTLTDVDAILGYLNPAYFLGGRAQLEIGPAVAAFEERVARPLGLPLVQAAAAMYRLANSIIHDLLHKATVQRGLDPRRFALFSFGGTAGMHVAAYGGELGVRQIVIPHSASVHGAFGLITSDIVHEDQTTRPMRGALDPASVDAVFAGLSERVIAQLRREGFVEDAIRVQRSIDMRYRRQVHILTVPVAGDGPVDERLLEATISLFERLYEEKYGRESAYREAGIELVSFRVRAAGLVRKPRVATVELAGEDPSGALVERRRAWVEGWGEMAEVCAYDFGRLQPGNVVAGPALIWTPITTVVVGADQRARVDAYRNLLIAPNVANRS
jgi:N-methylhydantoinase A